MKKFLLKISLFVAICACGFFLFLEIYKGKVDYFYGKFTTPVQSSLIIGDSRVMQGIIPEVVDSVYNARGHGRIDMYNFAFTIAQASYGPSYLEAIKKKHDPSTDNDQVFIVQVTPWMLSNRNGVGKSDSDSLFADMPPHNMDDMESNPNLEYVKTNFHRLSLKKALTTDASLSPKGYTTVSNIPTDSSQRAQFKKLHMKKFNAWKKKWRPSDYRVEWLEKTVQYLSKNGKVVLVRMPFDAELLDLENEYWPALDSTIETIASNHKGIYLNYSKDTSFDTYDGHHLTVAGASVFTERMMTDALKSMD